MSRSLPRVLIQLCAIACAGLAGVAECAAGGERDAPRQPVEIMGWLELARLDPGGLVLRAKLDTGAKNSSINASKIERFERNGKDWVRFSITNTKNKTVAFERPVIRRVLIRRAGVDIEERLAVMLDICIGRRGHLAEVNLADRSDQNYQVLLGRSYLDSAILVDSSSTFRASLRCSSKNTKKK